MEEITLRDFFAGCALIGILINPKAVAREYRNAAEVAFDLADDMLEKRDKATD